MKNLGLTAALAASVGWATPALADEALGLRKIVDMGCHSAGGTCFVTLDGASFGTTLGCAVQPTNEFRFDDADTAIGRRGYASYLAAFLSNRSVSVQLRGCSSQGYPTHLWYHVAPQ